MTSSARPTGRSLPPWHVSSKPATVYYCHALTPAGKWMHFRAGHRAYATTRDWAERVAGLKVDRDLKAAAEGSNAGLGRGVPMTDDYRIYVDENWPATKRLTLPR